MYGAITSSRRVRVEIVEEGLHVSRDDEPIIVREGPLELWLFAENKTTKRVPVLVANEALEVEAEERQLPR